MGLVSSFHADCAVGGPTAWRRADSSPRRGPAGAESTFLSPLPTKYSGEHPGVHDRGLGAEPDAIFFEQCVCKHVYTYMHLKKYP